MNQQLFFVNTEHTHFDDAVFILEFNVGQERGLKCNFVQSAKVNLTK